jgi:signal transduction histidine kinase
MPTTAQPTNAQLLATRGSSAAGLAPPALPTSTQLPVNVSGTNRERQTIIASFGIGLLAAAAFLAMLVELPRQQQIAVGWVNHTLEVLNLVATLDADLARSVSEARGFMIDKLADSNRRFDTAAGRVFDDIVGLQDLTADNPVQQSTLTRIKPMISSRIDTLREIVDRLNAGDDVSGPHIVADRQAGQELARQIANVILDLSGEERRLLAERRATARHVLMLWFWSSLICGLIAVASGLFAAFSLLAQAHKRRHIVDLAELNAGLEDRVRARNAEIVRQVAALERSNQDLDDFAYIASHDLKEPLRGLFNNARFLHEDYADKLDAEGVGRLLRLGYLCQRMEHLINDLLYFSRLGRQDLAIQSTDVNEVIRDIETMSETVLHERNATIGVPNRLPVISCDKVRLTEVFRNLIVNAIKYNTNDIKRVEIGYLEETHCDDRTEQNVFYVKDNGMGIAKEFHEDIFRIFKRLNAEDDDKKGTGAGLTFVRKIVQRHGGRVWLDSVLGEGTTFYFTIGQGAANESGI